MQTMTSQLENRKEWAAKGRQARRDYLAMEERDYLRPDEVNDIIEAAGRIGRNGLRDQVLLRLIYRHGLRVGEAIAVRWSHFDLQASPATLHVHRLKGSADSRHVLDRDERLALVKLRTESARDNPLFVFVSERGGRLTRDTVAHILRRAAEAAGIAVHVHPHMLRHAAGYMLANTGTDVRLIQAHLGHKRIDNTVRYTALSERTLAEVRVR